MRIDTKKLAKRVKRVNAKIDRLNKKGYDIQRISAKAIRQDVRNKAELMILYNQLDAFSKRGSEKKYTKDDIFPFEMTYARGRHRTNEEIKAREYEEYKNKEIKSRGKGQGYTVDQAGNISMGSVKRNSLKPKNFNPNNKKEFDKFNDYLEMRLDKDKIKQKNRLLHENYIKGLINYGYSEEIQKIVYFTDDNDFLETMDIDTEGTFDFAYSQQEMEIKEEALREVWNDPFIKKKERYLKQIKKNGADSDIISTLQNMTNEEFVNTIMVENNRTSYTSRRTLQNEDFIDYNIITDINQVKTLIKK